MKHRGRILRDANSGSGLISSEGRQYSFSIEGIWHSDTAPVAGMVVEFEVDDSNAISALSPVSESQLAKEQADKALGAAKEKGALLLDDMVRRTGKPVLIATGLLILSWFFLGFINVQVFQGVQEKITFWKLLAMINSSGDGILGSLKGGFDGSTGVYGFLAALALAGPFVSQLWKDPRAHLGNCLPLLLMLLAGITVYMGVQDGLKASASMAGNNPMVSGMINDMMKAAMQAIHVGMGAYLSIPASVYLAGVGVKKFLAAKA